jgi:RNA polymerase sigma-70 factor (ECF subfamily)
MQDDQTGLIQLAQQGDAEACAELYNSHYDAVYRYCYYRVSDAQLAQDLAAEVFVRMVEKLDSFQFRNRPLLAWYTIARNLVADAYRQEGKVQHLPLDEADSLGNNGDGETLAHQTDRRLQAECLAAAMCHLTEEQRQVILLKFMEGCSNAQVARVLKKSEGAIKALQHRALRSLKRAMARENCYEA